MPVTRRFEGALFATGVLLLSGGARADTKMECVAAASQGQTLRDAHKLVEAREQFRTCAQRSCPEIVQQDCGRWLTDTEKSLPSVVLRAKDDVGESILDVMVSLEGGAAPRPLDGVALSLNPGAHTFHFTRPDGAFTDVQAIVVEGEQRQIVTATFARRGAEKGAAAAEPHETVGAPQEAIPLSRTLGWALLGAGGVALVVGGILGGVTFADKSSAHCNAEGYCEGGPLTAARAAASVSTGSMIAGGLLAASGGGLLLLFPDGFTKVAVAPAVGRAEAGVVVTGAW